MTGPRVSWALATRTLPGQTDSGDRGIVQPFPGGVLVGVVDGLGHGPEAAEASRRALELLASHAGETVLSLLERCHRELRTGRGVVMSLATIRTPEGALTWAGIGDVEGLLLRATPSARPPRERLTLRGGIVGRQMPVPHPAMTRLDPGDTLIFATDGVEAAFADGLRTGGSLQEAADRLLALHWKKRDDALVLVARYEGSDA